MGFINEEVFQVSGMKRIIKNAYRAAKKSGQIHESL